MSGGVLIFDVETHSRELLYSMPPEEFVRLIGYKWKGDDEVTLTTDLGELRRQMRAARWIVGHNIHDFDMRAVFGIRSDIPVRLAAAGRVYDTFDHAVLVHPCPREYTNRHGQHRVAPAQGWKPEQMLPWFGLDEQAYQLGVRGKTDDLKELALEFGDPELPKKARIADGFGKIPVDDPRYRDYLRGDVLASEAVAEALLKLGPLDAYALREQHISARKAVISSNGFRVDRAAAEARVKELADRREVILSDLRERYGLPTEGASPWETTEGKVAILAALADHGITPESVPDWPKTPAWEKRDEAIAEAHAKAAKLREDARGWREEIEAGALKPRSVQAREGWIARAEAKAAELAANPLPPAFGLSLSGDTLKELTKDTPAAELGNALAELKGQRSLAQLALDSCYPDGFAHPEITMLQRSGRWSTTKPGLTIWTARGEGAVEKSYFIPDNEDEVLLEIDYSNADARVVAWLSGDKAYAQRFEPGADGHLINAWAAWGKDVVGTDKHDPTTARYRQMAKPLGHGWSYGGQAKTLSAQAGVPLEDAKRFCDGMAKAFHVLVGWQDRVRKEAHQHGYVMNPWGRKMWVEKGREFTQAPALKGQSGTREIVCDAILGLSLPALRKVKGNVHDALLFSVPRSRFEACRDYLLGVMETTKKAGPNGLDMHFPAEAGPPGDNWQTAGH